MMDKDTRNFIVGTVVSIAFVLWLAVSCSPGWVDADRRACEAQGGQYINWRNEGHCYPAYSIPVTPTR
jgi:hypothetical protein